MQVVVVALSQPLAPFGVIVDECPLGPSTFGAARREALRALGLQEPAHKTDPSSTVTGPALVVSDELWVTRRALQAFLTATKTTTTTTRLALPASRLLELVVALQDLEIDGTSHRFPCAFVPAGVTTSIADAFAAPGTVIPYQEILVELPVPRALLGTTAPTTTWPLTSTVALRARHWLHVLRASHLAPQVWLLERALRDPLRSALRAFAGALHLSKTERFLAWKRHFVFRGKNTVVHPSAIVEASVLGDHVVIGPQAVILQSIVGDHVVVEQRAHVAQSTLGPRTFVSLNSSMQACVTFEDADACANNLQACVVGKGTGLTSFARALDTVLGGSVRVDDGGRLREVGELPCGVAFGPGSFVGAGVTVAAGRVVPAGVRVTGPADAVLRRIPLDLIPGTFVVDDGGLRPL